MSTKTASTTFRIGVIGAGYVGLTTAVCLASMGHTVTCSDAKRDVVNELNRGRTRIYEPNLEEMIAEGLRLGRLGFTSDNLSAIRNADFVFVCVQTPTDVGGFADLQYVHSVFDELRASEATGTVIVRSTVPVGTCSQLNIQLEGTQMGLVFAPEFLREGTAVSDFFNPYRMVIGAKSSATSSLIRSLFADLDAPVLEVDFESAEMIKYASNVFLAMKVSFINEVSRLCGRIGGNIEDVARGVGLDERIGSQFLSPGPGWGGSCFPKDVDALVSTSKAAGLDLKLIGSVAESNRDQIEYVATLILQACKDLNSLSVAVLGLAFKSGTGDIRESPALKVIRKLIENGISVSAYDPIVDQINVDELLTDMRISDSLSDAVGREKVVAVLTEWPEFADFSPQFTSRISEDRVVIDTRRIIDEARWREAGFRIFKLGSREFHEISERSFG